MSIKSTDVERTDVVIVGGGPTGLAPRPGGSRHRSPGRRRPTAGLVTVAICRNRRTPMSRPQIVIVGAGFAGYHAARRLSAHAAARRRDRAGQPDRLLPLPAAAARGGGRRPRPRRITVSLPATLPGVRLVARRGRPGRPRAPRRSATSTRRAGTRPSWPTTGWSLAAGSVNKLLPVPGVAEHAHGFRDIAEALYLRDHVIRQIELAAPADDEAERDARSTFVVVGAGYTGTEVAAQGQLLTDALARSHPRLAGTDALAAARHRGPGAARAGPRGCRRPPTGCCASRGVEVRTGDLGRAGRPRRASTSPTASACRPAR